jgi:hypothetical protein
MLKPEDLAGKSILIATPMYNGDCKANYVHGLIQTILKLQQMGVNVFWSYRANESLITRARNVLAHLFIEKEYDYLMFIDSDIGYPAEAVPVLMLADKDIACGIYAKKEIAWGNVHQAVMAGKTKEELADHAGVFVINAAHEQATTDDAGVFEVRHGGTGFMLIKREVFLKLQPHVPTFRVNTYRNPETGEYAEPLMHDFFALSIDKTGAYLSEDYHFCELWRQHGGQVFANPFIPLEHVGSHVFTGSVAKAGLNLV